MPDETDIEETAHVGLLKGFTRVMGDKNFQSAPAYVAVAALAEMLALSALNVYGKEKAPEMISRAVNLCLKFYSNEK